MHTENKAPPPGQVAGRGNSGEHEQHQSTAPTQKTQALTPIQQRILMLLPSVDPGTLEVRSKLMTARDYAATRMADWHEWPERAHCLHSIAILWSTRAALSPWPPEDLEATVEMVRRLILAANAMRDLGALYGEI